MINTSVSISVIIPVYNGTSTIQSTLDSVVRQRVDGIEVILVDDGSTDDLETTIAQWKSNNHDALTQTQCAVHLFQFENAGQAIARNRGIKRSQGRYIAFLDADDQWSVDKLRAQALFLDQHPEVGLVYSWTDCVDGWGTFVCPGSHKSSGPRAALELLIQNYVDNGSSPMVRREVLDTVGIFSADLPPAEDWDLWLRIAERYPIASIPIPQVHYQVSRYSSSSNTQRLERAARQVLERALQRQYAPPLTTERRREGQQLRSRSLANLYIYLYFQIFRGGIQRRRIPPAMGYLFQIYRHEAQFRQDIGLVFRAIAKVICLSLLPNRLAQKVLNRLGSANSAHVEILRYISTELPPAKLPPFKTDS
ncbi:MAG: glycosyltransferase family A protein [Cyanobacteria bacterium P01_H01_bin.130]